jgi:hypothetical protein
VIHVAILPDTVMKSISLFLLLIVTVTSPLSAQSSGRDTVVLRVGSVIDNAEVVYFGLFPDISRPCAATVLPNDSGWTVVVQSESVEHVLSLSVCEYEALAGFLDVFEAMGASEDPFPVLEKELRNTSRVRCFLRLMQKRVISFSALQKPSGKSCELVLRDGTDVSGIPLEATLSSVALWTLPSAFNVHDKDIALQRYRWSEVDSVSGQWYTNSPQHGWLGWLIATGGISYLISETQRDPWEGRGGTGHTAFSYPVNLLFSGIVALLPMLAVRSIFGEAHGYAEVNEDNLDEIIETLQEARMYTISPPEARSDLESDPEMELLPARTIADAAADQSSPGARHFRAVPDLDAGISFLFNIYDVRARPIGTLPAVWIGKEIPVLYEATSQPVLSLLPRAALGLMHAATGINLVLNTGRVNMHLGMIHIWNWDELGKYAHYRLDYREKWEAQFVDGDVSQAFSLTFGFDVQLLRIRVLLEAHIPLEETVAETYQYDEGWGSEVLTREHTPRSYPGISLSLSYPVLW